MKKTLLSLSALFLAMALGGCASTGSGSFTKFGVTVLKNPQTGKSFKCWFRETPQTVAATAHTLEANYQACIRNARASGFTHEVLVTRYP